MWIVVDASTDGTAEGLRAMAADDPGLRVLVLPRNRGKGAAVLHGIELAHAAGFTHVLTMDSDGQHPTSLIGEFMAASAAEPSWHGAGCSGVRLEPSESAREGAPRLQLVG